MEKLNQNAECQDIIETLDPSQDPDVIASEDEETPEADKSPKKPPQRSRRFSLVCYLPLDDIVRYLKREKWIQHWAYCHHDKDVDKGAPKEAHTHIILYTYDAKTSSAIRKIFKRYAYDLDPQNPQNTLASLCTDPVGAWHYLIHKYDPDKYQYSPRERHCDNAGYWTQLCRSNALTGADSNSALAMIDDMRSGLPTRTLVARYGRDYVYNRNHLTACVREIVKEEINEFQRNHDLTRQAVDNITHTIRQLCDSISGAYSDVQMSLFQEMLAQAMNNVSVLEGWTIKLEKEH